MNKINFNFLKKIFFYGSILYFVSYFFINLGEIKFIDKLYYNKLLISFLFCSISIFLNGLAWKNIIIWFGGSQKLDHIISFFILSNSLKYVPGGIWHFVERFNFLSKKTNKELAFYSILIEPYFMLSASLLLISFGIFINPLFVLFLLPSIFLNKRLIDFVLIKLELMKEKSIKLIKNQNSINSINVSINIKSFFPFKALLMEMTFIITKFLGFVYIFQAFNIDNDLNIINILIVFCLSWSIGLVVPAAPSGLGVFETSFLFFIGNNYPQNTIIMSLICFRLIATSADLILSAPLFIRKFIKN